MYKSVSLSKSPVKRDKTCQKMTQMSKKFHHLLGFVDYFTIFQVNLSVIGDFEIIGSGLEAKAVHQVTKEIYDCKVRFLCVLSLSLSFTSPSQSITKQLIFIILQILSDTETLSVGKVICRLNDASSFYSGSDVDELWYVFTCFSFIFMLKCCFLFFKQFYCDFVVFLTCFLVVFRCFSSIY